MNTLVEIQMERETKLKAARLEAGFYNIIGGQRAVAASQLPVVNPATGEELATVPDIDYHSTTERLSLRIAAASASVTKKINFSTVFAGQAVGIKEAQDDIWLVSFMDYDLGYFDLETRVLEPLENPFGPKV